MDRSDQSAPQRRFAEVAQSILAGIADGRFLRGSKLPADRDLATMLGVSRSTAREALLVLELIGAIDIRHGDGVYVSTKPMAIDEHDVILNGEPRDLIESRGLLEPVTTRLTAERISAEQLVELRELIDRAEAAVHESNALQFREFGFAFHSRLAACCGNQLLGEVVAQLVDVERHPLWTLINDHALRTPEMRLEQIQQHRTVLDAIEAGDGPRAEQAMRAHLVELERTVFAKERPSTRNLPLQ
ncbi:FadR/GntR family transcriptional regulator [Nakamurella leprariae]|uniref:FadR family transcriptional regulator n=1 Tax=Nakamurella leprariae TaxID=2803911 RepID=A0A938YDP9_9ACTN|nr:FCD domain-containing protein [Nakamurella leprariae]MBM9465858.1 FadR family transcriptional regulator [Nakamurella leprariae]